MAPEACHTGILLRCSQQIFDGKGFLALSQPRGVRVVGSVVVAGGRPSSGTDPNSKPWLGIPSHGPGTFHTGTLLRCSQQIFDGKTSPALWCCGRGRQWEGERNGAVLRQSGRAAREPEALEPWMQAATKPKKSAS